MRLRVVMVKRKTRQRRASKLGLVYHMGNPDRGNFAQYSCIAIETTEVTSAATAITVVIMYRIHSTLFSLELLSSSCKAALPLSLMQYTPTISPFSVSMHLVIYPSLRSSSMRVEVNCGAESVFIVFMETLSGWFRSHLRSSIFSLFNTVYFPPLSRFYHGGRGRATAKSPGRAGV